ncbi:MAG TPA: DUF2071 domain-containing protein [Thermoanaerobaculia bacterium]|nr:DUF2071 domain-containing protein [Thermoanaerobaculia bacterium]
MKSPDDAARVDATREPDATPVMHQDWHHLLFLHWEVSPSGLQGLLPPDLDLDTFEGKAYVGLVPFTVTGARASFTPPLPGISSFHEVNVRTYVHRGGRDPGVWFFSLDASSGLAVDVARAIYRLPYVFSAITFEVADAPLPEISFQSVRDDPSGTMSARCDVRYRAMEGPVARARPGTLEFFLMERYLLYAADGARNLLRARVFHQPYPLQRAEVLHLEETLVWASGIRRPDSVPLRHYAREVNVTVYPPERC